MAGEQDISYAWIQIQTADGAIYPFAIDPDSYVKRDIVDFAPRAGGGDVVYSNLDLYQIVTQDSWHHGIGFVQFRDKFGYRITSDGVDTRPVGMAMMFQKYSVAYSSSGGGALGCVDFGGATYINAGAGGIWKRTTAGVFSKVLSANVVDLITNGSYLIASISGARMQTSSNGTSWSNAGVGGNPPNSIVQLEMHNGFVWGSESGVSSTKTLTGTCDTAGTMAGTGISFTLYGSGSSFLSELVVGDIVRVDPAGDNVFVLVTRIESNTIMSVSSISSTGTINLGDAMSKATPGASYDCVHFWSSGDSSDAEGGGIADVGAIVVGSGSSGIKAMASFNGSLHIARQDGVWAIDDTVVPPVARRVLNFSDEQNSSNFSIFVPWRGRLYFNIKNALYAYNGSSLANVTPPTFSLDFPPLGFGAFTGATYRGPYLYVIADTNEATPVHCLLAFDGTGWFKLLDLGAPYSFTGIGYSALANMLFLGRTDQGIWSVPLQANSELPYADFDANTIVAITNAVPSVSGSTPNFSFNTHANLVPDSVVIDYNDQRPARSATSSANVLHDNIGNTVGSVNNSTGLVSLVIANLDVAYGTLVDYQYYVYTQVTNAHPSVSGSNPNWTFNTHVNIRPSTVTIRYRVGTPVPSPETATDDGNGTLHDSANNYAGTINYATGVVSLFANELDLPYGVYVDYQWYSITTVTNAVPSISGSTPNFSFNTHTDLVADSVVFDYHLQLIPHTANDSNVGALTNELAQSVGSVNYNSGLVSLIIADLDVPSGLLVDYQYNVIANNHYLNMSEIDFGFRRVKKSFAEIDLEVYNVTTTRFVAVDYSSDGASWQRLGQTVTNGVTKLNFTPTVEANKLDVRMNFQTDSATQSAILRNVTIKAMIRPDTLYGHQMVIIGSNEIRMLDNRFNPGSSEQQRQWIEAARASKAPITFIDQFGISHLGYLSTAQFLDIQRRPGESQSNWRCRINLVEVR